ncbi:MAG: hypothetical protein QOI42_2267, partial [Frankiaceae bacterium]|nr:hypothetical protein [Frankiaceae bacterium]
TQLGAGTPVLYSDGTSNGIASDDRWPAAAETVPTPRPVPLAQHAGVGGTDEWVVASIHLDPDDIAPRVARRWARELLHQHGQPSLSDVTASGLTEVVTNACLHACTPMTVTMSIRAPATVRFGVRDYSVALPIRRDADDEATTGRGLALLAACGPWGVQEHADGKTVWFEPHTAGRVTLVTDPPEGSI